MILLDTNVVSEPLRPAPDAGVIAWLDAQPLETLYLSSITVAELRAGVALLPKGRRRDRLHVTVEREVLPLFTGRVLPFDLSCTQAYADVLLAARRAGSPIATADALIAAVTSTHGLLVATRDATPFRTAGLTVIDPWSTERG
ncbi:type II toxin-antitoxin system VapC family toxin [Thermomonas flagellata]|uniref:type II toxin-antitoxin system VapC family toxin n=1 Tax=Thermomonas flagellata TaxID=2888524 RepID=UPI001F048C32|nr:type II toxin-antitoxin system VapC family toxin [Thermomonas flagellata]